jgi:hypothetical protein
MRIVMGKKTDIRRLKASGVAIGSIWLAIASGGFAGAQTVAPMPQSPPQVVAVYPLPGIPTFTPGPSRDLPDGSSSSSSSSGSSSSGSLSGSGSTSSANVMATLVNQSWGISAISDAMGVGVSPSALAATCVAESGCGADTGDGSGAQGVFQMYPAAYQEGLQTALAADPTLASEIVPGAAGMNDPLTESIAADGYLLQAGQALQNDNISNPTVLDARSYYEFGPSYGPAVVTAQPTALMSSILPSSFLSSNGISGGETVSQWQASVTNIIGTAAKQSVLS